MLTHELAQTDNDFSSVAYNKIVNLNIAEHIRTAEDIQKMKIIFTDYNK